MRITAVHNPRGYADRTKERKRLKVPGGTSIKRAKLATDNNSGA